MILLYRVRNAIVFYGRMIHRGSANREKSHARSHPNKRAIRPRHKTTLLLHARRARIRRRTANNMVRRVRGISARKAAILFS